MDDRILAGLDRLEKRTFALVVFIAKVITWTGLLALAVTVEAGLVIKVFEVDFGDLPSAQSQPAGTRHPLDGPASIQPEPAMSSCSATEERE